HRRPLDVEAMARASAALLGEHDFLSYCRPRVGASTVRELRELRWERPGEGRADEGLIVATVVADAFCHHMVRSLVGALISVGAGRRDESWPAEVLGTGTGERAPRAATARTRRRALTRAPESPAEQRGRGGRGAAPAPPGPGRAQSTGRTALPR